MTLVHNPPFSIGDTSAISLQTANVTGLQPVGIGGTPNAPMQLISDDQPDRKLAG